MIIPVVLTNNNYFYHHSNEVLSEKDLRTILRKTINSVYFALHKKPLLVYNADNLKAINKLTYDDFLIFNPRPKKGTNYSIKLATEWINHNYSRNVTGIMFFLGNSPFVSRETIDKMAREFRNNESNVVIAKCNGKNCFPIIIGKDYFNYLINIENSILSHRFLKNLSNIRYVECDETCRQSINTKQDLEKVKKSLS